MAPDTIHHAPLRWLWETKSPLAFVSGPQNRIETGKAIIGEIVPQALKSYQHEGWDWLGGHLWPHALSWHEVALAIACQFPPAPGFPNPPPLLHQALLPGSPFFFLPFLPPPPSPKSCPPVIVPGRWPLMEREGEKRERCELSSESERGTKLKVCNHTRIVSHHDRADCWYFLGEKKKKKKKTSLTRLRSSSRTQNCEKYQLKKKKQGPKTTD